MAEYDNYGSPLAEYPIDTGRMRHVIDIVATMAGWGRTVAQRPRPGDCHASVVCHLRDGAEIMSRFIPACMIALAREYFAISRTHCLKNLAA